jgi:hypothetical protein
MPPNSPGWRGAAGRGRLPRQRIFFCAMRVCVRAMRGVAGLPQRQVGGWGARNLFAFVRLRRCGVHGRGQGAGQGAPAPVSSAPNDRPRAIRPARGNVSCSGTSPMRASWHYLQLRCDPFRDGCKYHDATGGDCIDFLHTPSADDDACAGRGGEFEFEQFGVTDCEFYGW